MNMITFEIKLHSNNIPYKEPNDIFYKAWFRNKEHHREDGPAIMFFDGTVGYWLFDGNYTKKVWEDKISHLKRTTGKR